MSSVDLHPEELFDQLRTGALPAQARVRLEAHCAQCSACLFELRWMDSAGCDSPLTLEDRARGEAAFDNVLRATKGTKPERVPQRQRSRPWLLRLGVAGLLLGTGLSIATFIARQPHVAGARPDEHSAQLASQSQAPASQTAPLQAAPNNSRELAPSDTSVYPASAARTNPAAAPSADALLAAARHAQTRSQFQSAAQLYRKVIEIYPTTRPASVARVALGRLLYDKLAQPRAALQQFDAYLRQRRDGSELAEEALYYRALALAGLGRKHQAEASLRVLLESFPSSVYAQPARARLAAELRE